MSATVSACVGFPKKRIFPKQVLKEPLFSLMNTYFVERTVISHNHRGDVAPLQRLQLVGGDGVHVLF